MYIKVEVETKDSVVYKTDLHEILIGSAPSNSIVIKEQTVSKKHLKIIQDEGNWYAIDQGSTNGSFVDEEQLIPGKRVAINDESVIGVGDKVTIILLEHADGAIEIAPPADAVLEASTVKTDHDKTQILSLADLKAMRAQVDVKKKKEQIVKKAQDTKRKKIEKSKVNKMAVIAILIVIAGIILNNAWKIKMKKTNKQNIIAKMKGKFSNDLEIESEIEGFRIPRNTLVPKNKLASRIILPKCDQPETVSYCELSSMKGVKENGVVFLKSANYIFFLNDQIPLINARAMLNEGEPQDENALLKQAFIIYFQENFQALAFPKDSQVYVVFYDYDEEGLMNISRVSAFYESSIPLMLSAFKEQDFVEADTYFTFF